MQPVIDINRAKSLKREKERGSGERAGGWTGSTVCPRKRKRPRKPKEKGFFGGQRPFRKRTISVELSQNAEPAAGGTLLLAGSAMRWKYCYVSVVFAWLLESRVFVRVYGHCCISGYRNIRQLKSFYRGNTR